MNIRELKGIIRQVVREEVRSGMSEMLREILTEAVEIASRPEEVKPVLERRPNMMETIHPEGDSDSITDLLRETQKSMTREDYTNIQEGAGTVTSGFAEPGTAPVGDELPSFAKNAKAIFDASFKHDK